MVAPNFTNVSPVVLSHIDNSEENQEAIKPLKSTTPLKMPSVSLEEETEQARLSLLKAITTPAKQLEHEAHLLNSGLELVADVMHIEEMNRLDKLSSIVGSGELSNMKSKGIEAECIEVDGDPDIIVISTPETGVVNNSGSLPGIPLNNTLNVPAEEKVLKLSESSCAVGSKKGVSEMETAPDGHIVLSSDHVVVDGSQREDNSVSNIPAGKHSTDVGVISGSVVVDETDHDQIISHSQVLIERDVEQIVPDMGETSENMTLAEMIKEDGLILPHEDSTEIPKLRKSKRSSKVATDGTSDRTAVTHLPVTRQQHSRKRSDYPKMDETVSNLTKSKYTFKKTKSTRTHHPGVLFEAAHHGQGKRKLYTETILQSQSPGTSEPKISRGDNGSLEEVDPMDRVKDREHKVPFNDGDKSRTRGSNKVKKGSSLVREGNKNLDREITSARDKSQTLSRSPSANSSVLTNSVINKSYRFNVKKSKSAGKLSHSRQALQVSNTSFKIPSSSSTEGSSLKSTQTSEMMANRENLSKLSPQSGRPTVPTPPHSLPSYQPIRQQISNTQTQDTISQIQSQPVSDKICLSVIDVRIDQFSFIILNFLSI